MYRENTLFGICEPLSCCRLAAGMGYQPGSDKQISLVHGHKSFNSFVFALCFAYNRAHSIENIPKEGRLEHTAVHIEEEW